MILLDASVLIAYLDSEDAHHADAERLLAATIDDEFAVNTLTLAEVLVVPARDGRLDAVRGFLRDLEVTELRFPSDSAVELRFPGDSAVKLAQLRVDTGLKMPDCCVLLAAEDVGARIASFDDRLVKAAEARHLKVLPH